MIKKTKYLIIGAGSAGLGAGWHLKQKGIDDWLILEKESYAGGLSASFKDDKGFYWDLGGHVLFGSNKEFIEIIRSFLGKGLVKHRRKAGIYFKKKFIPYPFQDNIACLPKLLYKKTQKDLNNRLQGDALQKPGNFQEWLCMTFGKTLSEIFFIPQNEKSWAYPLSKMSFSWIAKKIKLINKDSEPLQRKTGWGSNAEFYYPKNRGIGVVWKKMAQSYGNKIEFKSEVTGIDIEKKKVYLKTGKIINYEYLISTMPLTLLLKSFDRFKQYCSSNPSVTSRTLRAIKRPQLYHNRGLVIGLGIKGKLNNDFHWLYYPQKEFSFFRLVFPSNFSFVPKGYCSIIAEVSLEQKRKLKKSDKDKTIKRAIDSIKKLSLFKGEIVSVFDKQVDYFYPIPTLKRDDALKKINIFLNKKQIYSIGRFGGWKYEKGNMDDGFLASKFKSKINI